MSIVGKFLGDPLMAVLSILLCVGLTFLITITFKTVNVFSKKNASEYNEHVWCAMILIIALVYPQSFLRTNTFEHILNWGFARNFLLYIVIGIAASFFSRWPYGNKRYNFRFVVTFPFFEEILFRGVILAILVSIPFISNSNASRLCGVLFGIMHFQYIGLGFDKERMIKVLISGLGGYFFSIITLQTQSILPAIFLHYTFNISALSFAKMRIKKNNEKQKTST